MKSDFRTSKWMYLIKLVMVIEKLLKYDRWSSDNRKKSFQINIMNNFIHYSHLVSKRFSFYLQKKNIFLLLGNCISWHGSCQTQVMINSNVLHFDITTLLPMLSTKLMIRQRLFWHLSVFGSEITGWHHLTMLQNRQFRVLQYM